MNAHELAELVEPTIVDAGFELVECNVSVRPRSQIFRIYIDSEDGVPVDACARVSRKISETLDQNPLLEGSYSIEVSSPGMNRKIWSAPHFRRFRGEKAKIDLREPEDGIKVWIGEIVEVGDEDVELLLENGAKRRIRLDEIEEARLRMDPWKRKRQDGQ